MSGMDAHGHRVLDLRADLALGFFGFDVLYGRSGVGPEISIGGEQAGNGVLRGEVGIEGRASDARLAGDVANAYAVIGTAAQKPYVMRPF